MKRNYWPTKAWEIKTDLCLNLNKLNELDRIIPSKYKNINSIIVVKNGYIAFEKYYNGFTQNDTNNVASITKSFISALIGIAIDKGYIKDVNQKVMDFFPEYNSTAKDIKKAVVTIKHLLTMTAPFALSAKGLYEPLDRLRRQRDWVKYIISLMGVNAQLGKFQYSTASTHLLSVIITKTTNLSAREFANKYLFKDLGITQIPDFNMKSFSLDDLFGKNVKGWVKDPQNNTIGGWGLNIIPRDLARFGYLYLNNGTWNNKEIISKKWIKESTSFQSETIINKKKAQYGYLWWLRNQDSENSPKMYLAMGSGGNIICCIPEKDLVVVITSKITKRPLDRFPIIDDWVLAATID